jgi:hypothetical protein
VRLYSAKDLDVYKKSYLLAIFPDFRTLISDL